MGDVEPVRRAAQRLTTAARPSALGRAVRPLRLTARGWGLATGAVSFAITGVAIGSADLVRIAVIAAVVLVVAVLTLLPGDPDVKVARTVTPEPLHVGGTARVRVTITGTTPTSVHEQVAPQLAMHGTFTVWRRTHAGTTSTILDYTVGALARGRWPLGPLTATRTDLFGTVQRSTTLGTTSTIAVWPYMVPLGAPDATGLGEPERVALGLHEPSPDDVTLNEYAEGDDLRRVHWASSARRGRLMVRAEEYTGLRPVTVVAAVPPRRAGGGPDELEWTLSFAASVACAAFDARHLVRLVGLGGPGDPVSVRTEADGRARLLAPTLDVTWAANAHDSATRLGQSLASLEPAGQLVVVVLGTSDPTVTGSATTALAELSAGTQCWVVTCADGPAVTTLGRAGCTVVVAQPGEPLAHTWSRLVARR
ncbi:MAG: DUF58 domain-containing protein [Micrococcales bacterium]|nr:DUF58 domain-containing protein [Micrococcales bacterium]